jgi:hypothetical protein
MDRFMRKCRMDRKIVQNLIEGQSFNKISKMLKVSKKRIRKVYELSQKMGYLNGTPLPTFPEVIFNYSKSEQSGPVSGIDAVLLNHLDWIKERREAGWHMITIWEELPVTLPKASFYRFIKRHKIEEDPEKVRCRIKVVSEIIHEPGEALILDWGKLCDVIDPKTGKKRTVWFLVGIMGFSRYMIVRLVWDNKTETTLNAIESMFSELGGIPRKITSDNPKCFALEASNYEPLLNPAFERFCDYYGTVPEMLPPRSPEKKGKVERVIPYVRRLFESYGPWEDMKSAQNHLDKKISLANERKHGTTKLRPIDDFLLQEASVLKASPKVSFEMEEYHQGSVRVDGHVRFRGKYYSVDETFTGKEVFIIGSSKTVQIYHKGNLLETHPRITNPHQSKSTKSFHLKPHERVIRDSEHYIIKARKIGPNAEELIKSILLSGNGFLDTRKVWGILGLDKDYSKENIDKACKDALECGQLSYRTVITFLNLRPKDKEIIPKSKNNKFVRNMEEYKTQLKIFH